MPEPTARRSPNLCLCRDCARATALPNRCKPKPCHTPHPESRHSGPGVPGAEHRGLRGRPLRRAAVAVLLRTGRPCSPAEVLTAIESWGYTVASTRPGKAVADALAYEADRGWLQRVERGRYRVGRISRASRYRIFNDFH